MGQNGQRGGGGYHGQFMQQHDQAPLAQRPQPQQTQPGIEPSRPQGAQGFDMSLSLAQALGQVLSRFNGMLASEADVDAKMRHHPQGANWRSCLEVMVEQSVRHGALHPECPDIRLSVHSVASYNTDGTPAQQIMVSHPVAAPFKFYCESFLQFCCRGAGRVKMMIRYHIGVHPLASIQPDACCLQTSQVMSTGKQATDSSSRRLGCTCHPRRNDHMRRKRQACKGCPLDPACVSLHLRLGLLLWVAWGNSDSNIVNSNRARVTICRVGRPLQCLHSGHRSSSSSSSSSRSGKVSQGLPMVVFQEVKW